MSTPQTITINTSQGEFRIDKWRSAGRYAGVACVWAEPKAPNDIGVHWFEDGTIHVVNCGSGMVRVFWVSGTQVRQFVLRPRVGVAVRRGAMRRGFMHKGFGPERMDLPSRLSPSPNKTGDYPTPGVDNGSAQPLGDKKGYAHGGEGVETSTGYDTDVAYHRTAEDGHWNRMPIWIVDRRTGLPARLGGSIVYNLNDRRLPFEAAGNDEEWPVAHWGSHQGRLMRHGDSSVWHAQDALGILRAWMLAEECSWGEWSETQVGPLAPRWPGEYIQTSLEQRMTQPEGSGHYGAVRELGWVARAWARWIDILRRGWVELPSGLRASMGGNTVQAERRRVRARGDILLRYVERCARPGNRALQFNYLPTFRSDFGPGYGGQSFEHAIAVCGVYSLARALDRPMPACMVEASKVLYQGEVFPYDDKTWGPAHYFNSERAGLPPVTSATYAPVGDPAHVWNALAACARSGWREALDVSLRHWIQHRTLGERLEFCRALTDKSWSAWMESALEERG